MFNDIRRDIELIFEEYRKYKYYTLFIDTVNVSITSKIDDIGGGRSNKISDKTADAAIKLVEKKRYAKEFVDHVEYAVNQLPDIEKELIKHRYMSRNHNYINDYTVYNFKLHVSAPYYDKLRKRAFDKLHLMLYSFV